MQLLEFQLFDSELVYLDISGDVQAANQFTGGNRLHFAAEQRGQQALHPAGASARTNPAVKLGGVEMIGVKLNVPDALLFRIG